MSNSDEEKKIAQSPANYEGGIINEKTKLVAIDAVAAAPPASPSSSPKSPASPTSPTERAKRYPFRLSRSPPQSPTRRSVNSGPNSFGEHEDDEANNKDVRSDEGDDDEIEIFPVVAEDILPLPLDRGYAWVVTFASLMVSFIVDGIANSFGLMLVDFCDYFQADKASVMLIGSLLCGVGMVTGPIVGALVNKFGCRPVCMAGAVVASIGFFLSSFATKLWMLTISYGIISGFGNGLLSLPTIVCVSFYFERYRALAMGLAVCGNGIGTIVMGPVTNALLESMGWQNTMVILSGIALNGAVMGAFLRPNEPPIVTYGLTASIPASAASSRIRLHQLSISEPTGTSAPPASAAGETTQPPDQGMVEHLAEQYVRRTRLDSEEPGTGAGVGGPLATIPEAMPAVPESPRAQNQLSRPFPKKRLDSDRRMFSSTISGFDVSSLGNLSDPDALLKSLPTLFARRRTVRKSKAAKAARARQFDIAQIRAGITAANLADLRRPFYRRDIFYSGSVMNLTSARVRRSQQSLAPSQLFLSMTRIPGEAQLAQQTSGDAATAPLVNMPTPPKCLRCLPKPIVDVFLMMVDLGLMKDVSFLLLWLANLIVMLAFYVPLFFVSAFARELDVSEDQARYLNSAFGAANTVCRIASGWVASNPRVSPLLVNNISVFLSGVFCILLNFCTGFWSLLTVYTILGICLAPVITLTSEILCKLVGLDNLTNAFGLITLARGISVCIGSPLTASLYNEKTKYNLPFSFGGGLFIAGSIIFSILLLPRFRRKEEDNQQKVEEMIKSAQTLNANLVLVDGNQVVASSTLDLHALASPQRKQTLSHQTSTIEDAIPEETIKDYYEDTV